MSTRPSETDPLLSRQASADLDGQEVPRKAQVGPLEISRSTRYGILAGIWSATFLSVRALVISLQAMTHMLLPYPEGFELYGAFVMSNVRLTDF